MSADRIKVFVCLLGCILFFYCCGQLLPQLNRQREAQGLTVHPEIAQNMPPLLAFTQTALGSFRGLAVDYLWIRAMGLQQQQRFHEAAQLSQWITDLQPRFTSVWNYQSWNMAYNISSKVDTDEERWFWVNEGISLLRDKGLRLNPRSYLMARELAYTHFHKIGKFSVDAHWYYKRRFAEQWQAILGVPFEGDKDHVLAQFKPLKQVPTALTDFARENPEAFLRLQEWLKDGSEMEILKAVSELDLDTDSKHAQAEGEGNKLSGSSGISVSAFKADRSPETLAAAFLRRKVLSEKFNMDVERMYALMERFGPLDWRHPSAHSLYWAEYGVEQAELARHKDWFEILQLYRLIMHSVQSLATTGRIYYIPGTDYYNMLPDPRLFPGCLEVMKRSEAAMAMVDGDPDKLKQNSYRGLLELAVQDIYIYGDIKQAEYYYRLLREEFETDDSDDYTQPLHQFVQRKMTRGVRTIEQATPAIVLLLERAIHVGMAVGNRAAANRFIRQAHAIHLRFSRELQRLSHDVTGRKRIELPPFEAMLIDTFGRYMVLPPRAIPTRIKRRVWANAPPGLKQAVFERMKPLLSRLAEEEGLTLEQAFPMQRSNGSSAEEKLHENDSEPLAPKTGLK